MMRAYIDNYLRETVEIVQKIDRNEVEKAGQILQTLRKTGGRLFILGVGGSAANSSHAVNDFRKLAGIESYAPTDNVSELTARTNDDDWNTVFEAWLKTSKASEKDALLILSVGGGGETTSQCLVNAVRYAKERGAKVISIVSRDGGYAGRHSDAFLHVPVVSEARITPHAEGWQGVLWHLLVNMIVTVNG